MKEFAYFLLGMLTTGCLFYCADVYKRHCEEGQRHKVEEQKKYNSLMNRMALAEAEGWRTHCRLVVVEERLETKTKVKPKK